jgi:hypothetical protein
MRIKRVRRLDKRSTKVNDEKGFISKNLDNIDNKDIIAFLIAAYQLFIPLLIGLLLVGGLVTMVILYIF